MKGLKTRAISAVFFVVIVVSSIYASMTTAMILISIICGLCLKEFYQINLKKETNNTLRSWLYLTLSFFAFLLAFGHFKEGNLFNIALEKHALVSVLFIPLLLVIELYLKSQNPFENVGKFALGLFYIAIPLSLLSSIVFIPDYQPNKFMGILLLIWSNDTFAYLVGSKIGKNKLFPRISPGKTWEGTFGGGICTLFVAVGLSYLFGGWGMIDWIIIGLICSAFGTIGDLVESMLKRSKGIKDSGNMMPGHGGALDRFDAFIFVLPYIYVYLQF